MTDPIGKDRRPHARCMVAVEILRILGLHGDVVDGEIANIASHIGPVDVLQCSAGTLKALVADLQEFSLLRIHVRRFQIVDPEEAVVELPDIVLDEVAAFGIHATGPLAVGMVEALDVPA